jgi:hypothetical protein
MEKLKTTLATFICMGKFYWDDLDYMDQTYLLTIYQHTIDGNHNMLSRAFLIQELKKLMPCFFKEKENKGDTTCQ